MELMLTNPIVHDDNVLGPTYYIERTTDAFGRPLVLDSLFPDNSPALYMDMKCVSVHKSFNKVADIKSRINKNCSDDIDQD